MYIYARDNILLTLNTGNCCKLSICNGKERKHALLILFLGLYVFVSLMPTFGRSIDMKEIIQNVSLHILEMGVVIRAMIIREKAKLDMNKL